MQVIADVCTIVYAHAEFLRGTINNPVNRHFMGEKT